MFKGCLIAIAEVIGERLAVVTASEPSGGSAGSDGEARPHRAPVIELEKQRQRRHLEAPKGRPATPPIVTAETSSAVVREKPRSDTPSSEQNARS